MSKKWAIGAVTGAAAVATVLGGMVLDVGDALAAAPTASRATGTASSTEPSAKPKAALSAAAVKKVATAAADLVSPALVDILANTATNPAAGTGIVLTATGEVLTNYHVISGATRITATDIGTGRSYPATVIGYDAADDIAVLRLTGATGLPTATLATEAATVGQTVIGVGNAEGRGGAPAWAAGAVTNLSRSVVSTDERRKSSRTLTGMLQSTAPIVPGYSGGALVNTAGEVVGVDTCGSFPTPGTPATDAYAIPITTAMRVVGAITAKQT
jgi:S1-C subfamily serine protease